MTAPAFVSYAQNMEDILLWRAVGHVPCGCYIDIGAHDPRQDSVSRGFYELGWRGVHFEPDPVHAARLRKDRPDEVVHEVALSDEDGRLRFFVMHNSGNSTGMVEYAEEARRNGALAGEREVTATTLKRVCADLSGRDVHWMKIDVEGMEEKVLRGWDTTTLRPWIVVVEATRPNSIVPHHGLDEILAGTGYQFVFFDGLNRYYIADEKAELASAFSAPVNIFDLMNGCELAATSPFRGRSSRGLGGSWSWKLTGPLRAVAAVASRLRVTLSRPSEQREDGSRGNR